MGMDMEGGGRLEAREQGGRVFFRCTRRADGAGLYKVWLVGREGGELLLGTLAPEGEGLVLERTLPLSELRRRGLWPVERACCRLAFAFSPSVGTWRWEEAPQSLVDGETTAAGEWERMLLCRSGDGFLLASPLNRRRPIPLTALICLAKPGKVGGERCLIWRFDRGGKPLFPGEQEKNDRST